MDFEAWGRMGVLLVRPGALVMTTPLFGTPFAPAQVRLGLTLLFALLVAPSVDVPASATGPALTWVVGREMALGVAMGLVVRVLVAVAEGAGQLTGYQVGLSYGAMIDPQSGVRNSTLAILYANLTLVLCLLLGVHHEVIRAWLASYEALPIGVGSVDPALGPLVARTLAFIFVGALRLAAPVIAVLLVVEVMMGLMSRAAPSLNLLVVGAPLRLPVGLLVAAAALAALPTLITRLLPGALELAVGAARAFR
jgi:flagellar biosynthetic protein FliR